MCSDPYQQLCEFGCISLLQSLPLAPLGAAWSDQDTLSSGHEMA